MKAAVIQSNYLPWLGYFDIISRVNHFVFYDEMQYTKRDWRNRNYIKTPSGKSLISIPVITKGKYSQKISEVKVLNQNWKVKHLKTFEVNYKKSKYFTEIYDFLQSSFKKINTNNLSIINQLLIIEITKYLEINTKFHNSHDFLLEGDKNEKIINICNKLKVDRYLSGPFGKTYLSENMFLENNIEIEYIDYPEYKKYNQLWNDEFTSNLSIIDVLFNCGIDTRNMFSINCE